MSTTPGWYPDPSGPARLRWWDGSGWTEHVHEAAPQQRAAPAPQGVDPCAAPPGPATGTAWERPGKVVATPDGQPLAPLGLRLLARVVDGFVLSIIVGIAAWGPFSRLLAQTSTTGAVDPVQSMRASFALLTDPELQHEVRAIGTISLLISAVYTILPVKFYGATLGKAVCGVRVRRFDRGGNPTWWEAVARWLTSDLLGNLLGLWTLLDYAWPLFDRRRQALHDKLPGTVVVRR